MILGDPMADVVLGLLVIMALYVFVEFEAESEAFGNVCVLDTGPLALP